MANSKLREAINEETKWGKTWNGEDALVTTSSKLLDFFGASGSGKSLIAAITAAKALKDGKIDVVYIFDSEGGSLINVFKQYGVDLDRVQHIPVKSVEHCTTKMVQTYDMLVEAHQEYLNDPDGNDDVRAICILKQFY